MVHPAELWQETGRWNAMGEGLLKFKNRNGHDFALGATHEEVVTDYVRRDVKSTAIYRSTSTKSKRSTATKSVRASV